MHDAAAQTIRITHLLGTGTKVEPYEVTLTYATEPQLDAMAIAAGLQLVDRWHDWTGKPADAASTDPISVYHR